MMNLEQDPEGPEALRGLTEWDDIRIDMGIVDAPRDRNEGLVSVDPFITVPVLSSPLLSSHVC